MEGIRSLFDFPHRHVPGQMGIQGILQFFEAVTPIEVKSRHLPTGMGAGVRAPGQVDRLAVPSKFTQSLFEFALRCPGTRLPLASEKAGSVISEDNLVTCHLQLSASSSQLLAFSSDCRKLPNNHSSTSSSNAISALSPKRGPSFITRV